MHCYVEKDWTEKYRILSDSICIKECCKMPASFKHCIKKWYVGSQLISCI